MIRHSLRSADGSRRLNVAEDGDPGGKPVFALHGTPGSMILYWPHVADASRNGIRLISYDRPGYGGSTPHPGRKAADAAKDVEAIADSLGLERFAVWGVSGGGPHALACAALLPKRIVAAATLASPAPYPASGLDWLEGQGEDNVAEFSASLAGPEELGRYLKTQREQLLNAEPEQVTELWESLIPPVDREVFVGGLGGFLVKNMREGFKSSYEGWKEDDLVFVTDWGFKVSDLALPLLLFQGRQDKMVPFSHGEWLAQHIKGAEARLSDDDGHLTLFERRVPEVHSWILKHF